MRRPRKPDPAADDGPDERRVRTAALALLARRDFGRVELRGRLLARGCPAALVEPVLDGLAAERLLSDERFVEQFVRQHAARGHGPARIRAELRQRGVDDAVVGEALTAAGQHWAEIARSVRRRRFGTAVPSARAERAKQARFLQYRGFSAEQIRAALGPGEDDSD